MSAAHFEAKKHAYRQCQDGIVVSFLIHPADISSEIAMAALGTRFMVAFSEIGEDEKPKEQNSRGSTGAEEKPSRIAHPPESVAQSKDRRAFHDLPYSQQAGIRCGDKEFANFLLEMYPHNVRMADGITSECVRGLCGVTSRADLDSRAESMVERRGRWRNLNSEFESWQTSQRYKDSVR